MGVNGQISLFFVEKWGKPARESSKNALFGWSRGGGSSLKSNVVEGKWGEMGGNGGKWGKMGKMGEFLHILLQNGGDLNE